MSGTVSRRRMAGLGMNSALPATDIPDPRARDIAALVTVDEGTMSAIREVFAGTGFAEDPTKVRALLQARGQVSEAWAGARNAYVEIGRALLAVDRAMDPSERDAMRRGFARLFPFTDAIATQLRQVARAVDDGRIPLDACPTAYSAAYQIALLQPRHLEMARARGLVRPGVSRRAVIAFRREVDAPKAGVAPEIDLNRLHAEARRLEAQRRRMLDAMLALRRRLREVRALIAEGEGGEG